MTKTPVELRKLLEGQQYSFIGSHSAIKICSWTKKSLRDEGFCYKQQFYGIKSHKCCQLTPSIGFCQNRCLICWRPTQFTQGMVMGGVLDNPEELIENAVKAQRLLLTGFKGSVSCNKEKLGEAINPDQFAISLSGEPTLYPKLNELIKLLLDKGNSVFVVSNGLDPVAIKNLVPPTQLYISLDAPNEELFQKIDCCELSDGWLKLNQSLDVLKDFGGRTALRVTCVKGKNMVFSEQWASLINKASPDFVEVKAYMWVGASQDRLSIKNMPVHFEVVDFAKEILVHLPNYEFRDEKEQSRVVLLMKRGVKQFI